MGAYEYNAQFRITSSRASGRVTMADGRSVSGARIILHGSDGALTFALTNPFGYYRIPNIQKGITYAIECTSKHATFATQKVMFEEDTETVDFISNL